MHKKAELRERPLDAEKRLRESMRSHFGKERCYMINRDGVEGVRERRARTRTSSRSERCTYTRSVAYDTNHVLCSEGGREEGEIMIKREEGEGK